MKHIKDKRVISILKNIGALISFNTKKSISPEISDGVLIYRRLTQIIFLILVLWIGLEFIIFVHQLERGATPSIQRPLGVEAFLPISALISLRHWILSGVLNTIHPSAVIILLSIILLSIILKKGFCSWVCPVGFF
ncbi:MAG: 4Fe-4S binding protein [Calditrichaeota bacterium]|nr:4Fe-4S binding protein [Calditrichota bacterium]